MKAVVLTLGCKVNQCESEYLLYQLKECGYEVSENLEAADLYIINTCAVTAEAEKKSRQTVAKINKLNCGAKIIVTGCASQNNPQAFINKDNVSFICGARNKFDIIEQIPLVGGVDAERRHCERSAATGWFKFKETRKRFFLPCYLLLVTCPLKKHTFTYERTSP